MEEKSNVKVHEHYLVATRIGCSVYGRPINGNVCLIPYLLAVRVIKHPGVVVNDK